MEKMKKKIWLWESEGVLAIILDNSGVVYTNQVAGNACCQFEEEGYLIPFNYDYNKLEESIEHKLSNSLWGAQYLTPERADNVDKILFDSGFKSVRVDRKRLKDSCEAWVYVDVEGELNFVDGYKNFKAVLTWQNSD